MSKNKIGRNDPCICGSGKKYKKCCMNKVQKGVENVVKNVEEVSKQSYEERKRADKDIYSYQLKTAGVEPTNIRMEFAEYFATSTFSRRMQLMHIQDLGFFDMPLQL